MRINDSRTKVMNLYPAILGIRHSYKSIEKSDSTETRIGEKDLALAKKLSKLGNGHDKFLRQIFVSAEIEASLAFWKQMDTYKIGTTANSESTMHTLVGRRTIKLDDFIFEEEFKEEMENIVNVLENMRLQYLLEDHPYKEKIINAIIYMLPSGYKQIRSWTANYAVLKNIYFQRKGHKLQEWKAFCNWIEKLPYFEELINCQ